ncbi:progressive ankylosis protein homolog B-like isoform X2 [Halichondria panicea]|uniref:progressive ankylosis protein homolog B-like isoform X2 n=1 Tax=Halichondria panicea TaxID=6063 RepID=UPI00312B38D9
MKCLEQLTSVLTNDYFTLFKFVVPLALTDVIADVGEQFLNRSVASSLNVVDTLAAFGLAYVFVKLFVGMLQEVKQVGVVLVHDRPGFHKLLLCVVVMGIGVTIIIVVIAKTQLGVWLIKDLHRVSDNVAELTYTAFAYLSVFPLIDSISWYHGGVLLQYRHSSLVGFASLAEIMAQIFCVAVLLYTPLVCSAPIVVPILSAYCGVITRCVITLGGFYRLVYPKLSKKIIERVTLLRLVFFISPLVFVLGIQRMSRPMINLLVARYSPNECQAATAVAVLTATYPLGRMAYGWLNQLRTVSPTFQKKREDNSRRVIAGKKVAIFIIATLAFSFLFSLCVYWVPGVSVSILVSAVGIPPYLALLCVDPLRVFSFFCFTVSVRASLTGWLTLHKQTKLVAPSGFIRLGIIFAVFFTLRALGNGGLTPVQQYKMRLILTPSSQRRMRAIKKKPWSSLPLADWLTLS